MKRNQLLLFLLAYGLIMAQPRITLQLAGGYYEPDLPGFDSNSEFPATNTFSKNTLLGFAASYQFFPNARIGLTSLSSIQSGKTTNDADFTRYLSYRMLTLETFFIFRKRMELNFTLAPMWNKGTISLGTQSNNADWDAVLLSYNNDAMSIESSNNMRIRWFGFASMIGFRFYIFSWMALDLKTGFMNNFYNSKAWKFQGKTITGPDLKIDKLPLFTLRIVFGW